MAVTDTKTFYATIATATPSFQHLDVTAFIPKVVGADVDNGYITRYFTRQVNHLSGEIVEIDRRTFERLILNHFYRTTQVQWRVAGALDDVMGPPNVNSPVRLYTGVITANVFAINAAEAELPGIQHKLTNPTQFWIGK